MGNTIFLTAAATALLIIQIPSLAGPKDGDIHTVTAGKVSMTIDASGGARIMSFCYDGKDVLSRTRFPHSYGSTFWTSPQTEWNWPPVAEFDSFSYSVEETDSSLILTGMVNREMGFRVIKEFTADGEAVVVKYSIVNESDEDKKVAPWEITRVPGEGLIFFDAPLESIIPPTTTTFTDRMPFVSKYGISWFEVDNIDKPRKVNADGHGWLAYLNDGLLLVKEFEDIQASEAAPAEAEVQVYVNTGHTYIELENQGRYVSLKPGERLTYSVRWRLIPFSGDAVPSEELIRKVRNEPLHRAFTFQGYEREYYIYIPHTLSESRPLVFMLHGHGGSAEGYYPEFLKTAQKYGFAVCCPQGLVEPTPKKKTGWNVGYPFQKGWDVDDCAFIIALSESLRDEYGLNEKNFFFSGMSNGGEMCYLMAHRYPEKFAAIASLAGLTMEWLYREMKPHCGVPFMEVHGTADKTSRWEGDPEDRDGWGKYISVPNAVGRMISTNCCTHEICDTLPVIRHTVVRHHYTGGNDGKDVILYEIIGGVHSKGEKDFELGEAIWAFFSRYLSK